MRCSVTTCKNDSERQTPGLSFHAFSYNPDIRKKWIAACSRNICVPIKSSKICCRHFEARNNYIYPEAFPVMMNLRRNMSQANISRLLQMAETAEERIIDLKKQVENLKKAKIESKIKELTNENRILAATLDSAKLELIKLETQNGKKQYPIPGKTAAIVFEREPAKTESPKVKKEIKDKDSLKKIKESSKKGGDQTIDIIDIRKLDLRIGKIIDINKHPDADSLYVEHIDCGEEKPRTVVSGLVNHVPIDQMRDRIVMVLCNLKPVKMRGVTSEAMVMCASSPEKVEVLTPPSSAVPGDLVECEGYPREPEPLLNPKKKIFETCAPDLLTNDNKVACYKGSPLVVVGKGPIVANSLKGVNVK